MKICILRKKYPTCYGTYKMTPTCVIVTTGWIAGSHILDCISDLKLRQQNRMDHQEACSLDFQTIMQIVIKTLFN